MVAWSEEYSVKVPTFDAQHKQLFRLIDQLHVAMKMGQTKAKMAGILDELLKYTKSHFSAEENAMISIGYPDFSAHKAEHEKFTRKIEQCAQDFKGGIAGISVDLMEFLNGWLANHILKTDQRYSSTMVNSYKG